ncbi:MAG: AlpA family phage regulatory protein [Methylophaga sp.]|nr:AlpA family phage regulatory protein [Methylophaga sp.]
MQKQQILRMRQVTPLVGLSRSSIYRLIQADKFPKPIPLRSIRGVGWRLTDIEQWIEKELSPQEGR